MLLSLREQADPQATRSRACPSSSRRSRRRSGPTSRSTSSTQLLGLASEIDTRNIRSYVFTPPLYQKEFLSSPRGYIIVPNVAKIRAAVKDAFTTDPADEALRQKLAEEAAGVWVLNGTGDREPRGARSPATSSSTAWPLRRRARRRRARVPADTTIVVYNGAETTLPGDDRVSRADCSA